MSKEVLVTNHKTGQRRMVALRSARTLERDSYDGVTRCTGNCRCRVEPDGECPNGWPSQIEVFLNTIGV